VKDFVSATGIKAGSRTPPDKLTPVPGKKKHFFSDLNGVCGRGNRFINLPDVMDDLSLNSQSGPDGSNLRRIRNLIVYKKL